MKIIDEKGKLFGKMNILDLIVVLLIIAAVVFVALKLGGVGDSDTATIEYKIEILGIREETVNALKKNSIGLYNTVNDAGQTVGDIVGIEVRNARELTLLENGEYTYAEHDSKFDVVLTVRTVGKVNKTGIYSSGGVQILCGEELKFSNGYCLTSGEVISSEVLPE